jgi:hypothetical protein
MRRSPPLSPALLVLLLAGGACSDVPKSDGSTEPESDTDTDTDTDSDSDSDTDTDTDTDLDIQDDPIWDGIDSTLCDSVPGYEDHPGATSTFVGVYGPSSGGWAGAEAWMIYATPAWVADGGSDCQVVWTVSAVEGSPSSCGTCDLGLSVTATLDASATTCPEELWEGDESFTVDYDVGIDETNSTTTWYWGSSGTEFGDGYAAGDNLSFRTDEACMWF